MANKLKVKNKQLEKMGIKKTSSGDYEYIEKSNRDVKNNVVASPRGLQK